LAVVLRLIEYRLQRAGEAQREARQQTTARAAAAQHQADAPAVLPAHLADAERELARLRQGGAGR
jgi:hypothetical protein